MRKITNLVILVAFLVGISPGVFAGVSTSAVLFLRIAAGARAAGMGEAFVAVADDATATHWNPAGLGNYPLSSKWFEVVIPVDLRPFTKVTFYENDASEIDYNKYDIWAISEKGLVRYSRNKWYRGDIIETRAEQSAESILRDYTGLQSEDFDARVSELMNIIGEANNDQSRSEIDSIEAKVMAHIPDDYDARDEIENGFIALKAAYNQCLIDWERFKRIGVEYRNAIKDSTLSKSEVDKLLFTVEKTKRRILAEELIVPFVVNFEGHLTDIASDKKYLWITSDSGLYRYDKKRWRHFLSDDENIQLKNITGIKLSGKMAYLNTDNGLLIYDAGIFNMQGALDGLPEKPIVGVAAAPNNTAWAIVEGDLYHFDGKVWKNYIEFQDVLDQTAESIYDGMKIFDNPNEKSAFIEKYQNLNEDLSTQEVLGSDEIFGDVSDLIDSLGTVKALEVMQDSLEIYEAAQAENTETETISEVVPAEMENNPAFTEQAESEKVTSDSTLTTMDSLKSNSRTIKIPFTAGIPFKITAREVERKKHLWIGTEYGLIKFDGKRWKRYGYRDYTVENDITVGDLATSLVNGDEKRAARLATNIKEVNMLESDDLVAGQKIVTYSNPAGSKINEICPVGDKVYFGTEGGTIFLENGWSRFNEEGLGGQEVMEIAEADDNLWFAANDKILIRAAARSEVVMMHVNWLPELADDIYYEFFSYVKSIEGWGTVGTNITFLSYGSITRTDENSNVLGEFSAFDFAMTLSYGTPLSRSLSGGVSAKVIYSHLSELGTAEERGSGTSTGLALDIGLLYKLNRRVSLGMALTNIGPAISYIDVAQADPLPRNLAFGVAWKAIESNYSNLLLTVEGNKSMVAIGDIKDEFKEVVLNGGMEYWYGSFIALRLGYIYDQEGEIKTPTLGFGLAYSTFKFDFAYIPSSENVPLANTMRLSLGVGL